MKDYIKGLDGLRAVAIAFVVVHHAHYLTTELTLSSIAKFLGSGVDLFFIISGFLITQILLATKGADNYFRSFYLRRLLRIVPLYYLVLGCAFFIVPILNSPHLDKLQSTPSWPYWLFLSNFYIAHQGAFTNGLVDLSWSLSVEEQFYIFWSVCIYLLSLRHIKFLAFTIIIFSPVLRYLLVSQGVGHIAIYVMSFTRMDTLMIGALLAIYRNHRFFTPRFFTWSLILAAIISPVVMSFMSRRYGVTIYYSLVGWSHASVTGLVIAASKFEYKDATKVLRFFEWKPLVHVGLYSYGIYLFHNPIQKGLRVFLVKTNTAFWESGVSPQILFYIIAILSSAVLGGISFHVYEKKWVALKSRFER